MKQEDWKPIDIISLESVAEEIVKSNCNILVTAGPGAGKTELLAQRTCYLLQTDTCRRPKKILAISFKRDAANNLKQRVQIRCGREFNDRFVSVTFDSFFKDILDRFKLALPDDYKIGDYDVDYIQQDKKDLCCKKPILQLSNCADDNNAKQIWNNSLSNKKLSFKMISRLCELILEQNPILIKCLQLTYSHILLDEFQDITEIQYSILTKCFKGSSCILTAVGNDKQRIMLWAGAIDDAFDRFRNDFGAIDKSLSYNYRSVPKLVDIQKNIAQLITRNKYNAKSILIPSQEENVCNIVIHPDEDVEAMNMAFYINKKIRDREIAINDICILMRRNADLYSKKIISELNKFGIKARVEDKYQKLLSEPLINLIINFLKLWKGINSQSWNIIMEYYEKTVNIDNIGDDYISEKLDILDKQNISLDNIDRLVDFIIVLLDEIKLKQLYPQYKNLSIWMSTITELKEELKISHSHFKNDLKMIINDLEGLNSIPIMTTHKSKGLEYELVIFLGLEDSAFYNYPNNPQEESCVFFVALSRAKQKILFTITENRQDKNGNLKKTTLKGIKPIFEKLKETNIGVYRFDTKTKIYKHIKN